MSVATPPLSQAPPIGEDPCAHCHSPLAVDQEWCLECGTARTLIHRAPDWRAPVAIVGGILALALLGLAIAFIGLSADANRSAAAQTTASTSTAAPAGARPSTPAATPPAIPAAAGAPIARWPIGLGGWTVVLAASQRRAEAQAAAQRIGTTGIDVGVLSSSQHPSMPRGFWVVFSGRYPTREAARAKAAGLRSAGQRYAHARLVAPPGG